jgi:hypothetical protein
MVETPMQRRQFTAGVVFGAAWTHLAVHAAGLSEGDAALGIRSAIERGATAALASLGRTDGFLGNPKVRIPLPGALEDAAKLLKATGQQHRVDELIVAMNRAAEAAMPQARALLVSTAKAISVDDAIGIVRGGDNAATAFFSRKTRAPLTEQFLPIVTHETEKVALAEKFNAVAGQAARFGLLKGDQANIQRYVTAKSLDGLYLMIGEEERKIRSDPIGTGSAILKKVFGA